MILKVIIIIIIISNLITIFFLYKKKIKNYLYKSKIKKIDITDIHEIFNLKEISKNLKGPKKDVIIKSFSISQSNNIVGMTSDQEAWIIASLSKISKNIFEFGTCSGKTTYLMGLNSDKDTKIISITLSKNEISEVLKKKEDNEVSFRNIVNESIYSKFLFSGEDVEKKIKVIFQNSLEFNHQEYIGKMDLIFIDGGHTYSVVKNDSEKAFSMLSKNGIILWHDYVPGKQSAKDVVKYIHEISKNKEILNIKGTTLAYFKNE
jgi:predicted O-methyltransferase YrrM|tara:strand:- start:758 stop:1543 length:786 start_codon:yes stop_codon:yes gene_type:complete